MECADKGPTCPVCLRVFKSYNGRRVHERSAHPEVFHQEEVAALTTSHGRPRWEREELEMMACFEAVNCGARSMNILIREKVLPHRLS